MNLSQSRGSYRTRQVRNDAKPVLPLHRSSESLAPNDNLPVEAPNGIIFSSDHDNAGGGMGSRQDTSMIPLRRGEVRVPMERPPVIFGRWASVTQTGEMFPSDFSAAVMSSPAVATNPHEGATPASNGTAMADDDDSSSDRMEAMEKTVSNMLLDDEEMELEDHNANSHPDEHAGTQRVGPTSAPHAIPSGLVLIPKGLSSSADHRVNHHMLKRISDHFPKHLFPPPPPPLPDLGCYDNAAYSPLMRKKMMRWYQIVELWCIERTTEPLPPPHGGAVQVKAGDVSEDGMGERTTASSHPQNAGGTNGPAVTGREVADNERAIIAPPPRPPMFSEDVAPTLWVLKFNAETVRPHAPYTVDQWVEKCRFWWTRVMHTFDRLRDDRIYKGFHHVSKGEVGRLWTPGDVALMIGTQQKVS